MSADDNHTLEQIQLISDQLMSAYEYQSVSFYYPYCYEIQSGSGLIRFYGAEHFRDPENYQFEAICSMIRLGRPELVLVEHHQELHRSASKATGSSFLSKVALLQPAEAVSHSESRLAVRLAAEVGAQVECPEPTYEEQWRFLYARGYSIQQIAAYYLTRAAAMAPFWTGLMTLPQVMEYRIGQLRPTWPWEEEFLSPEFANSFLSEHYGFDIFSASPELLSRLVLPVKPETDIDFCVLNAVGASVMNFIDSKIVLRIGELSKQYADILVIFGATHMVRQEKALRSLLRANTTALPKHEVVGP